MTKITDLTTAQLNSIIAIKEQIENLQSQLDSIASGNGSPTPTVATRRRRRMSRAGRARIIAAVKARWAKYNGKKKSGLMMKGKKSDRRSSPAVRAKLAAAARARWAKVKAQGKKTL
jgi:hypothetical protein